MNPLVILPLLVASAFAAPTNIILAQPGFAPAYAAAPLAYAAPVAFAAPAIETKIHYADTPVVSGYTSQILKPALGTAAFAAPAVAFPAVAAPAVAVKAEKIEVPAAPVIQVAAAPAPLAYSAPVAIDLKAAVPAGDAPAWEELVQKEKVLAPVRAVSKITPQLEAHLPAKVNVEKFAVDVNVPHPVPVSVPFPVHTPVFAAPAAAAYAIEVKH